MGVMLACICMRSANTWQASLVGIPESAGRNEMMWVRKHGSNTWFLVSNYAFIWYWLSKLWLWPARGHKHLRGVQLLWGIGHRNAGYQHVSPWVVCYKRSWWRPSDYSSSSAQWLHQPHCACVQDPTSHLFLGAARAEFKALHGEGFHDTSLQVALTPKPFVHCCYHGR